MSPGPSGAPPLDWPALLRAGLQGLRLRPQEFWALTPGELSLMLGLDGRAAPMGRGRFEALAALFPDQQEGPEP